MGAEVDDGVTTFWQDVAANEAKKENSTIGRFIEALDQVKDGGAKYACGLTRFGFTPVSIWAKCDY